MKPLVALLAVFACSLASAQAPEKDSAVDSPKLLPLAFQPLPLGEIKPDGWLKSQLRIQADGISGHLHEFWPDIKDSGWIGGKAEGWERVPYWLDGVLPLAIELDDAPLKETAQRYIDYILTHQQEDGWLGPNQSTSPSGQYQPRDPWPVFVLFKVLTQYHEATGDPRVIPAMTKFLRRLDDQIRERPLFDWNKFRWQDLVLSVHWLYDRTGDPWLLEFAKRVHDQGYDWFAHFRDLPCKERAAQQTMEGHGVNNGMAIKTPSVWYRQSADPADRALASAAIATLDRYHGTFSGVFTCDECVAGLMPSQGTETCTVVEYMFSLETMIATHGDPAFADRLERIAFNALPAPFTADMWGHQYDHQANQVLCKVSDEHVYVTNGPDANLFGLEPNYGCCTANLHQGWPKFASHLWMKFPDNGLAAVAYAPCTVETKIGEAPVKVVVDTAYPFDDTVTLRVTAQRPVEFPLYLRVPAWSTKPTLQTGAGEAQPIAPGSFYKYSRKWEGTVELKLQFPMSLRVARRYNDAVAVERGPLVYSLKIGEDWRKLRGEEPHADYEVYPTTPWNYALAIDETSPEASFRYDRRAVGANPFSPEGAPVSLKAKGKRIPAWQLEKNAAAPPPQSPVTSTEPLEDLTLIPYGSAKLRLTEFPALKPE